MSLIQCPDCGHDMSDAAAKCPHCGRPHTPVSVVPQVRPWVRYWARFVDIVVAVVGAWVILAVAWPSYFATETSGYGAGFLALFIWVFVEALLVSSWGTTPGKALMRVSLRTTDGENLPFDRALARAFRVWFFGLGIGFPVITVITTLVAYNKLKKNGRTSWDAALGIDVRHEAISAARWAAVVIVLLVPFVLAVLGRGP
jgi:hypothetical protein